MLRTFGTAVVAGSTVLMLAACGGAGDTPTEAPASPVEESADTGSGGLDILQKLVGSTEEVTSFRAVSSIQGGEAGEQEVALEQEIRYTASPEPVYEAKSDLMGMEIVTIIHGDEVLMDMGSGWTRTSLSDVGELGVDVSEAVDPGAQVAKLQEAADLSEEGQEEVNGVATTKFAGTLPVSSAIETLPEDVRAATEQEYADAGLTEIPFTLWVDGDDLPRRIVTDMGQSSMTVEYLEFNGDITIELPSEDQITDGGSLLGG
ncbi:LppX_LprAFG lipoprotein [Nocardiopsis ansamitocini]|uniref:Lipoprotein n=1 Tax=Nocardiopsis ansamitocini TaxID=1670832 RepID=A0A9W6UKP9_9ACTN|nr:LppX_LprAFG lipoprotein [Nocardiopsis ansamitocini]GLU49280.1 putative lipoprotein [Nocardiopsis ansamitocini]